MIIYQPSDLAGSRRTAFMDEARTGRAVVRHKDGTNIVALPQAQLDLLEGLASWSRAQANLTRLLRSSADLTVENLGELAWLRSMDRSDVEEFADELHAGLIAAMADEDLAVLEQCVADWKTTARQLEDPLRRSVLLEDVHFATDLEPAPPPMKEPDESNSVE